MAAHEMRAAGDPGLVVVRRVVVRGCALLLAMTLVTACAATGAGSDETDGAVPPPGRDGQPTCSRPVTAELQPTVEPITSDAQPEVPVTYTDITGSAVTVTDASRILALDTYGTLATTVYALGLGDRLVGRDVSTAIPELMDLPLVTQDGHQLNGEAILDLRPTVVLTDYSIGPLEVQLQLMDAGIPVVIMSDQRSRAEIGPQIEAVAQALGVPQLGTQLAAGVADELATARSHVAELAPADEADRLRIVFLYLRGNAGIYYWFGEGSGADDLIEELGGVDVASQVGLEGMRPINAEGLVQAGPELYLMMTGGLESVGGLDGLLQVPGVGDTSAGRRSCVVDMADHQILSFGPQFPATVKALADAIYRQAVGR